MLQKSWFGVTKDAWNICFMVDLLVRIFAPMSLAPFDEIYDTLQDIYSWWGWRRTVPSLFNSILRVPWPYIGRIMQQLAPKRGRTAIRMRLVVRTLPSWLALYLSLFVGAGDVVLRKASFRGTAIRVRSYFRHWFVRGRNMSNGCSHATRSDTRWLIGHYF